MPSCSLKQAVSILMEGWDMQSTCDRLTCSPQRREGRTQSLPFSPSGVQACEEKSPKSVFRLQYPPWSGGGRSISVSDVHTTRCQSRTHTEKPQAAELANTCCSSTRQDRDEPCSEHRCSSLTGSWCGKNRLGKQAASHPRWQSCYHPKKEISVHVTAGRGMGDAPSRLLSHTDKPISEEPQNHTLRCKYSRRSLQARVVSLKPNWMAVTLWKWIRFISACRWRHRSRRQARGDGGKRQQQQLLMETGFGLLFSSVRERQQTFLLPIYHFGEKTLPKSKN